jgi:predicted metal-dependent phosphoesterase TrpH
MIQNFGNKKAVGIDLHTHTNASDGNWSAQQLIKTVKEQGIQVFSVCDHETTANQKELAQLARQHNLRFVNGVEIAVEHRNKNYHLLLYGFQLENRSLQNMLEQTRQRLQIKKEIMGEALSKRGYYINRIKNSESTSPVYELATALVETNQRLYFREAWELCRAMEPEMSLAQPVEKALAIARNAGAVTVLAHPGRGGAEITVASDETLEELVELGLDGLEVYYSTHTPAETERLLRFSQKRNLLVSCGSDSHDENRKPYPYNSTLCLALLERLRQIEYAWAA